MRSQLLVILVSAATASLARSEKPDLRVATTTSVNRLTRRAPSGAFGICHWLTRCFTVSEDDEKRSDDERKEELEERSWINGFKRGLDHQCNWPDQCIGADCTTYNDCCTNSVCVSGKCVPYFIGLRSSISDHRIYGSDRCDQEEERSTEYNSEIKERTCSEIQTVEEVQVDKVAWMKGYDKGLEHKNKCGHCVGTSAETPCCGISSPEGELCIPDVNKIKQFRKDLLCRAKEGQGSGEHVEKDCIDEKCESDSSSCSDGETNEEDLEIQKEEVQDEIVHDNDSNDRKKKQEIARQPLPEQFAKDEDHECNWPKHCFNSPCNTSRDCCLNSLCRDGICVPNPNKIKACKRKIKKAKTATTITSNVPPPSTES